MGAAAFLKVTPKKYAADGIMPRAAYFFVQSPLTYFFVKLIETRFTIAGLSEWLPFTRAVLFLPQGSQVQAEKRSIGNHNGPPEPPLQMRQRTANRRYRPKAPPKPTSQRVSHQFSKQRLMHGARTKCVSAPAETRSTPVESPDNKPHPACFGASPSMAFCTG